ncbi:MAG: hypothetical protein NVSMB47_01370 [Polyangiales bacterium]
MKQNSQRRDPDKPAAVTSDELREGNADEASAEAARDARLRTAGSRRGDEATSPGRTGAEIAGGQGEQKSRERARLRSEQQGLASDELFAGQRPPPR